MTKDEWADASLLMQEGIHIGARKLMLTGEVDEHMYEQVVKGVSLIQQDGGDQITVELNSEGGNWHDGMAIYDYLRSCGSKIRVRAWGCAMSAGSIILQAGSERLLAPGTTIMVHDGADMLEGSPEHVMAWAKYGKDSLDRMYKIYADASGKTVAYWKKRCKSDFILSAEAAVKLGLADRLI